MGIFFHRRAERSNCHPAQVDCEQNVCTPEDPRTQYMEMRNQCTEATQRNSAVPRQFQPCPPAPGAYIPSEGFGGTATPEASHRTDDAVPRTGGSAPRRNPSDLPPLTLTEQPAVALTEPQRDLFQYGGDGKTKIQPVREVPLPPLPDPQLIGPVKRDLYQYGDGNTRTPQAREVPSDMPLPPLPDPELSGNSKRDLYQYGDGNTRTPQVREGSLTLEVPPQTIPSPDLRIPIIRDFYQYGDGRTQTQTETPPLRELAPVTPVNREYRVQPEPLQQDGSDHPGPGSMRRRSLRERLGLPERNHPHRRDQTEDAVEHSVPIQAPRVERERERERVVEEIPEDRKQHRLSARLERIKEKLSRLTHLTAREREQSFTPTSEEQMTLELINNERRRYRLPDVVHDPRLQIIASRHTAYQIRHGMTHSENTPGWQSVSQRMNQVGLEGWRENAASGSFEPRSLVQMWMNSPGHRAAILGQGNIAAVSIRGGKATFNLTTDPEFQRQG